MKRIHRLLLSILSGLLLSLPWLGFPGWTLFIAFTPLLILNNFFVKNGEGYPGISFWGHAFLTTLIWNIASSWWMAKVSFTGVGTAMLFNSFLMSLVLWLVHSMYRKHSSRLGSIAFIVFWLSLEYLHLNWDMEWPCLQLGSVLASNVQIIQWYEYTGTSGGTIWILILNILLFKLGKQIYQKRPVKQFSSTAVTSIALLAIPIGISLYMYHSYAEIENSKQIVIIQPNVDPYTEHFDIEAENKKLKDFIALAGEVTTNETDFIIGPETIFENQWYWNEDHFQTNNYLLQLKGFIQSYDNPEMVFGVSSFKVYSNIEEVTTTARNKDDIFYDRFNTALFLNREGETQVYHKSKLVMGVEKTPFLKHFSIIKDLAINLGGTSGTLGQQNEASNFVSKDGTFVAPVICFESVFGEYVAEYVKKGAQIIFVITNDGWWKNSRGYKQHLLFSQLRTIETRRSIARSGNTGTSCFINQRGDVLQPTEWWTKSAISGSINVNKEITFYVKYGDYIARISLLISILLLMNLAARRFTKG